MIIAGRENIIGEWKARFQNQKDLTRLEKKQKRKWKVVAIVATGLFVWVSVSP